MKNVNLCPMIIVGIDPGAGGGIAIHDGTVATCAPLEAGPRWLYNLLMEKKAAGGDFIVLIEKVGLHLAEMKSDQNSAEGAQISGKSSPAIIFRLQTMIASSVQAYTVVQLCGLPVCWVQPRSWQAFLGLGRIPGESDTQRKGRYRAYAAQTYPGLHVTLKTQDAVCLMEFGRRKWKIEPAWFNGKLVKPDDPVLTLF